MMRHRARMLVMPLIAQCQSPGFVPIPSRCKEVPRMPNAAEEAAIQQEIKDKGLNGPRVTPEKVDAAIVSETYTVLPSGKCMICELTLRNGFTVRGEASAVSKENFNEEIGRKVSRSKARDQIWQLEGYLLQDRLAGRSIDCSPFGNVMVTLNGHGFVVTLEEVHDKTDEDALVQRYRELKAARLDQKPGE